MPGSGAVGTSVPEVAGRSVHPKPDEKRLLPGRVVVKLLLMSPLQEQFSLILAASEKQIPSMIDTCRPLDAFAFPISALIFMLKDY
jgi:hypothetical protein